MLLRPYNTFARIARCSALRFFQRILVRTAVFGALLNELRDERSPAGLMTGTDTGAIVTVKVLVKQDVVLKVRIRLEALHAAEDGAPTAVVSEDVEEAVREFACDFPKGQHMPRSGWALDLEFVTVEMVEFLECFDEQVIDREPNRAAPI